MTPKYDITNLTYNVIRVMVLDLLALWAEAEFPIQMVGQLPHKLQIVPHQLQILPHQLFF